MIKKNRLKEVVLLKIEKKNSRHKDRSLDVGPMSELRKLAKALHVSYWTAFAWYANYRQPKGDNEFLLPKYYGMKFENFYYSEK